MDKVEGKELGRCWDSLAGKQKYSIVQQLVEFERKFASSHFAAYGSLYYKDDLPTNVQMRMPSHLYTDADETLQFGGKFAIGPTNSRMYFDDGRSEVDIDRGPCESRFHILRMTAAVVNIHDREICRGLCSRRRSP